MINIRHVRSLAYICSIICSFVSASDSFRSQIYTTSRNIIRNTRQHILSVEYLKQCNGRTFALITHNHPHEVLDIASHHFSALHARDQQDGGLRISELILTCYEYDINILPFAKAVARHIDLIDPTTLNQLMACHPYAIKHLVDPICHYYQAVNQPIPFIFIDRILHHCPEMTPRFYDTVICCIENTIMNTPYGNHLHPSTLKKIFKQHPDLAQEYALLISSECNIKYVNIEILGALCHEKTACDIIHQCAKAHISALFLENTASLQEQLIQLIMEYPHLLVLFPDLIDNYPYKTPSIQHILEYGFPEREELTSLPAVHLPLPPRLSRACQQCLRTEYAERNNNRYVFYHGQKWEFHFYAQLFKNLWKMKNGHCPQNYEFLRYYNTPYYHNAKQEREQRYQTIREGNGNVRLKNNEHRILFLNAALCGNNTDYPCNSMWYFTSNNHTETIQVSIQDMFTELGIPEHIYHKYKDELERLKTEHRNMNSCENMLMLSLTRDQVANMVYLAAPYGYKKSISVRGKTTDDVCEIVDALAEDPGQVSTPDNLEFCMPLTCEPGGPLDPHSGIRIFNFHPTNHTRYMTWEQEFKMICRRIEQDYTNYLHNT